MQCFHLVLPSDVDVSSSVDTCWRLVRAIPEVPLGGAVISVKVEEDLYQKVEVGVSFEFFPDIPAAAVRLCILEVYLEEAPLWVAL